MIYQSQFLAKLVSLTLSLCLLLAGPQVYAGSFFNQLMDKDDGWFDASDWVLENAHGFMPVPIIITEPAVGEGLGVALLFFHAPKDYSTEKFENSGKYPDKELPVLDSSSKTEPETDGKAKFVRPNISAVAAAATNNGTWFTGGGHFARWKDDTVDYKGVVGYASEIPASLIKREDKRANA